MKQQILIQKKHGNLIGDQLKKLQCRHDHRGVLLAVHTTKGSNTWKCDEVVIVELHRENHTKLTIMQTTFNLSIPIASEELILIVDDVEQQCGIGAPRGSAAKRLNSSNNRFINIWNTEQTKVNTHHESLLGIDERNYDNKQIFFARKYTTSKIEQSDCGPHPRVICAGNHATMNMGILCPVNILCPVQAQATHRIIIIVLSSQFIQQIMPRVNVALQIVF